MKTINRLTASYNLNHFKEALSICLQFGLDLAKHDTRNIERR